MSVAVRLYKFTGDELDWHEWKTNFWALMASQECHVPLDKDCPGGESTEPEVIEWNKANLRIASLLTQCCHGSSAEIVEQGLGEDGVDGRAAWLCLKKYYDPDSIENKRALRNEMTQLSRPIRDDADLLAHIDNMQRTRRKMKAVGLTLDDADFLELVQGALPDRLESLMHTLDNDKEADLTKWLLKIRANERRRNIRKKTRQKGDDELALIVTNREQKRSTADSAPGTQKQQPSSNSVCVYCRSKGHAVWSCRIAISEQKRCDSDNRAIPRCFHDGTAEPRKGKRKGKGRADHVQRNDHQALVSLKTKVKHGEHDFIVDSGASDHIVKDESLLTDIDRSYRSSFQIADGTSTIAKARGTVTLHLIDAQQNRVQIQFKAICIPEFARNLFSVDKAIRSGVKVLFEPHNPHLLLHNGVTVPLHQRSGVYVLSQDNLAYSVTKQIAKHWHVTLGHPSPEVLQAMARQNIVDGLPAKLNANFHCDVCAQANMTRKPQSKHKQKRANKCGELTHTDLCGPFPPSIGNKRFAIVFTDDHSRFRKAYFLSKKSQAHEALSSYIAYAKSFGVQLTTVRTDCGGEFTGHNWIQTCRRHTIHSQASTPYKQAQNGIAERSWRKLEDVTRALIKQAQVAKSFWTAAFDHAVYLTNRLSTRAIENSTPFEMWTGDKPNVSEIKPFGARCFVFKERSRAKLDDKASVAKFLGYDTLTPGLRVTVNHKSVVVSGNVSFVQGERCGQEIQDEFHLDRPAKHVVPSTPNQTQQQTPAASDVAPTPRAHTHAIAMTPARLFSEDNGNCSLDSDSDAGITFASDITFAPHRFNTTPATISTTSFNPTASQPTASFNPTASQPTASFNPTASQQTTSVNPAASQQSASFNPTASQSTSFNPTASQQNVSFNPTASQQNVSFNPTVSQQNASFNPTASQQKASFNPTASRQTATFNPSASQQSATFNPSASQRSAALNPSASQQTAALNPSASQQTAALNPSASQRTAALNPSASPQRVTLNPSESTTPQTFNPSSNRATSDFPPASYNTPIAHSRRPSWSQFQDVPQSSPLNQEQIGSTNNTETHEQAFDQHRTQDNHELDAIFNNVTTTHLFDTGRRGQLTSVTPSSHLSPYRNTLSPREPARLTLPDPPGPSATDSSETERVDISSARNQRNRRSQQRPVTRSMTRAQATSTAKPTQSISSATPDSTATPAQPRTPEGLATSPIGPLFDLNSSEPYRNLPVPRMSQNPIQTDTNNPFAATHRRIQQQQARQTRSHSNDAALYVLEHDVELNPVTFDNFAFIATESLEASTSAPKNVRDLISRPDGQQWLEATRDEFDAHIRNGTWTVVTHTTNSRPVSCAWIYKTKTHSDGSIARRKARLVIHGNRQEKGIDFFEVFAPVVRITTLRILLTICISNGFEVQSSDVSNAFVNANLDEHVCMAIPRGCRVIKDQHTNSMRLEMPNSLLELKETLDNSQRDHVLLLKKSLYGLRQSPRNWHKCVTGWLKEHGFKSSDIDECLFVLRRQNLVLYLALYVDDLVFGGHPSLTRHFQTEISKRFKIKHEDKALTILGMEFVRHADGSMTLHQERLINELLLRNNMNTLPKRKVSTPLQPGFRFQPVEEGRPLQSDIRTPYASLVGGLMYVATCTRPDICFAVSQLARFMHNPSEDNWKQAKRTLRYLAFTKTLGLQVKPIDPNDMTLGVFCDADWANDLQSRRSVSAFVAFLGQNAINWSSRFQRSPALSTAESEYYALAHASQEAVYLRQLCSFFGLGVEKETTLLTDSQGAIAIAQVPNFRARTRHIETRYHFVRYLIAEGKIKLQFVQSSDQLADSLTKAVTPEILNKFASHFLRSSEGGIFC